MEYELTKIGDTFDKVVVLMPGAKNLFDVCHPIVAIDAAHMKDYIIERVKGMK
jgi:hypothetical protein